MIKIINYNLKSYYYNNLRTDEIQLTEMKNLESFQNEPMPLLHPYPLTSSMQESHTQHTGDRSSLLRN
jgi:hypothetical protein